MQKGILEYGDGRRYFDKSCDWSKILNEEKGMESAALTREICTRPKSRERGLG